MGARRPRWGSLQFYPRKRSAKTMPSINWDNFSSLQTKEDSLLGFITYKVGMKTAIVKDTTPQSMTANKKIAIPVTILETPKMKVFSVRFYKGSHALKDIVVSNDKELRRAVRVPKTLKAFDSEIPAGYDDVRVIVYSLPKETAIKKTPDLIELGVSAKDKLAYIKTLLGKELALKDVFKFDLLDVRGQTKGKGLVGPIKRFGLTLKSHKSEKGVRRPGSLGPWHPARVTFRAPQAGQMGMFSRVQYNMKPIFISSIAEKNINPAGGFPHFGNIKSSYIVIKGSVQGPQKRAVLLAPAFRPTNKKAKTKLEFVELQ